MGGYGFIKIGASLQNKPWDAHNTFVVFLSPSLSYLELFSPDKYSWLDLTRCSNKITLLLYVFTWAVDARVVRKVNGISCFFFCFRNKQKNNFSFTSRCEEKELERERVYIVPFPSPCGGFRSLKR